MFAAPQEQKTPVRGILLPSPQSRVGDIAIALAEVHGVEVLLG